MGWVEVPFMMENQCQTQWCWAAVAASVARYYRPASAITQSELVNRELKRTDCSCAVADGRCNEPSYLAPSLDRAGGHLKAWLVGTRATEAELIREIDELRPVCIRVARSDREGHFVVVVGYLPGTDGDDDGLLLKVEDPDQDIGTVPFSYRGLSRNHPRGPWTDTLFTRRGP